MALIQRYSTELSSTFGSHRRGDESVGRIGKELAAIQRHDEDERHYLHSLNDRLEDLLGYLDQLEAANKQLRGSLQSTITSWGIQGDQAEYLKELDHLTRQLSEKSRRRIIPQAEAKLFNEQAHLTDRVSAVFIDVLNSYRDHHQILHDLIRELEEEFLRIQARCNLSYGQVKSHDDDYQRELAKFRTYLAEWSQVTLDKQKLLHEIQSLKERYHLRLAYNQEEINEWKRLLARISQESKNYYRDYLDTVKQQIQMDYEKMAKDQQMNVELELKSRLKEIQDQIQMGLLIDGQDEPHRREGMERFQSRLDESAREHERLQAHQRALMEENQRKRRLLQDLENEARNKARRNAEHHARLQQDTDLTRAEYNRLKDELDRLVHTLRFSVEEELKIYEALLNSSHRPKDPPRQPTGDFGGAQSALTTTTTTTTTKKSTGLDDSNAHRPSPARTDRPLIAHQGVVDRDGYGIQQNLFDRNERTTVTTKTTRRSGQDADGAQKIRIKMDRQEEELPELDENYMQSKIHITRKYKGNVLIKFVDVGGRFVEVENTGNQTRDLTGWSIERTVDGRRLTYRFPDFRLDSHRSVRVYGSRQKPSSSFGMEDSYSQLIATSFPHWGIGRQMRTELFNREHHAKALFEQAIKD